MFLAVSTGVKLFASGGTEKILDGYKIHTFNSSGTLIVYDTLDASILLLGVGGAGGGHWVKAGGGGAGGTVKIVSNNLVPGSYPVSIGSFPGGSSSFNGNIATGGGSGGSGTPTSGGGGDSNADYSGGSGSTKGPGGGGAGAGENGTNGARGYYGEGGDGIFSDISGVSVEYGHGGNSGIPAQSGNTSGIVIIKYKMLM